MLKNAKNKLTIFVISTLFFLQFINFSISRITGNTFPIWGSEGIHYQGVLEGSYFNGNSKKLPTSLLSISDDFNNNILIDQGRFITKNKMIGIKALPGLSFLFYLPTVLIGYNHILFLQILISLLGIAGTIYVYLSLCTIYQRGLQIIIALLLYIGSYIFFQYHLLLIDSVVALNLLIISFYYLFFADSSNKSYLIGFFFFSVSLLVRIDNFLLFPVLLPLLFKRNGILTRSFTDILFISIGGFTVISSFLISNVNRNEGALNVTFEKTTVSKKILVSKKVNFFERYFSNFNDLNYAFANLKRKTKFFKNITSISFVLLAFYMLTSFSRLKDEEKNQSFILILYLSLIYIYFGTQYFTDQSTTWLASVYSRYLMPYYYLFFIFGNRIIALHFLRRKINFLLIFIIFFILVDFYGNFNKAGGIYDLFSRKEKASLYYQNLINMISIQKININFALIEYSTSFTKETSDKVFPIYIDNITFLISNGIINYEDLNTFIKNILKNSQIIYYPLLKTKETKELHKFIVKNYNLAYSGSSYIILNSK